MNRVFVFLLLISPMSAAAAAHQTESTPGSNATSAVFFVATNGNDSLSGNKSSPGSKRTDGPFATLPRALQAVREWKQKQGNVSPASATIFVRGGLYFLDKALSILPEDSGLSVAAFRGEKPVLSGGRRITHWKPTAVD